jgi:hypothetical protein
MGIWRLLRRGNRTAPGVEGALTGDYDVRGDRIAGWAEDAGFFDAKANLDILVRRRGSLIATGTATPAPGGGRFTFALPIAGRFAPGELVDESVTVTARNQRGDTGTLLLDGATQLELIRAHLGVPCAPVLDLDFTHGGNAAPYLGAGWSGAERDFTWTEGDESVVSFDAPSEPGTYALRITAGAFIGRPGVPRQDMQVLVNDAPVASISLNEPHMQFTETRLDGALFRAAPRTTLRLLHPDAARPCDHIPQSKDARRLAFHFKRLSLVRLLGADA